MLFTLTLAIIFAAEPPKVDREPPELFYLEVDGKRVPVELDKPIRMDALAGAKTATLRVQPYRQFPYAGVRFLYPREYSFKLERNEEEYTHWELDGDDFTINIWHVKVPNDADIFLDTIKKSITAEFRAKGLRTRESPTKLKTKKKVLQGIRLSTSAVGQQIIQDVFTVRTENELVIILFQDLPDQENEPTKERVRVEKLLCDTIEWSEMKDAKVGDRK